MNPFPNLCPALRHQLCLLFFALTVTAIPTSAMEVTNQIIFLTLHLKGDAVTLVKAESFPGTLKPQPDSTEAEPLLISLFDTQAKPGWKRLIDDPAVQRYEYEDPDHPGQLRTRYVRQDDLDFVVRVPQISGARQISVSRISPTTAVTNTTNGITLITTQKLLGTFVLPEAATK